MLLLENDSDSSDTQYEDHVPSLLPFISSIFPPLSLLDFLEGGLVAGICQRSAIKSLFVVVLVDHWELLVFNMFVGFKPLSLVLSRGLKC